MGKVLTRICSITVCLYFCSRELCRRPYDVSLLGVYSQRQLIRDDSICSQTSFDRESSLRNDIYYLCRGPDVTFGTQGVYIPSGNLFEKTVSPTIQHPRPIRPKSQLRLDTDQACEAAEILSGTTLASTGKTRATDKRESGRLTWSSFSHPYCRNAENCKRGFVTSSSRCGVVWYSRGPSDPSFTRTHETKVVHIIPVQVPSQSPTHITSSVGGSSDPRSSRS